jgi:hypothetical protein
MDTEVAINDRNGAVRDMDKIKQNILERELANFKDEITKPRVDDYLVTARLREELDFLSITKR